MLKIAAGAVITSTIFFLGFNIGYSSADNAARAAAAELGKGHAEALLKAEKERSSIADNFLSAQGAFALEAAQKEEQLQTILRERAVMAAELGAKNDQNPVCESRRYDISQLLNDVRAYNAASRNNLPDVQDPADSEQ